MTYKFTILGRLSGINKYSELQRVNRYAGANLKATEQDMVSTYIRKYLKGVKITKPVFMRYMWYEPNKKRDKDNISGFGHKVIQDALVQCGVLKNDGWKEIVGYHDEFACDKKNPRIEVELIEVDDG